MENAVLGRANGIRAKSLISQVARSPALEAVGDELARLGLLVPEGRVRRRCGLVFLALLALEVLGIARVVNGIGLDRPVGILLVLVIGVGLLVVLAGSVVLGPMNDVPTELGDRVVDDTRAAHRENEPLQTGTPMLGVAVGAVLFGGLAQYPDAEIRHALWRSADDGGGDGGGGDGDGSGAGTGCGCGG